MVVAAADAVERPVAWLAAVAAAVAAVVAVVAVAAVAVVPGAAVA